VSGADIDGDDLLYRAPGVGQLASAAVAVRQGAVGEAIQQCAEFGQLAYESVRCDPLEVLCAAGLSWLVGVIQPLEDELGKVTGNVDRLHRDCEQWQWVADELVELSNEVRALPDRELAGWKGAAAGGAIGRLREFAEGLEGVAGEVYELRSVLIVSAGMFEVARSLVIEVVASLVEWAIVTWIAAQAAATVTCGASITFAIAQLDVEVALATERALATTVRVESALLRIERALIALVNSVATRLPRAATGLLAHPARELAGRLPGIAFTAAGQEAAALLDSSVSGLRGYAHLPQPGLLPAQLDSDRPLTRMR
jgi:hypothetical protein